RIHLVLRHVDADDNAIILCHHPLPSLLGSGSKPLQLFGLRKTPELSLALVQALSPLGRNGLSSSDGRLARTARSHILADLADTRGVSRSSRTRGGMRWSGWRRRTSGVNANGEVVWSRRPDAGVKLLDLPRGDGDKKARSHRGDHEISRKTSRRECRCNGVPVVTEARMLFHSACEAMGAASALGIPSALFLLFGGDPRQNSDAQRAAGMRSRVLAV